MFGSIFEKNWLRTIPKPQEPFPPALHSFILPFASIKSFRNEDLLRQKYTSEGQSIDRIAIETFSSKRTVKKHLLGFGVPLRIEDLQNKAVLPYGCYKNFKNDELSIRDYIFTLKQKHSIREIVEILNTLKIPTRKTGSRWHIKTVFNVCKRIQIPENKPYSSSPLPNSFAKNPSLTL